MKDNNGNNHHGKTAIVFCDAPGTSIYFGWVDDPEKPLHVLYDVRHVFRYMRHDTEARGTWGLAVAGPVGDPEVLVGPAVHKFILDRGEGQGFRIGVCTQEAVEAFGLASWR